MLNHVWWLTGNLKRRLRMASVHTANIFIELVREKMYSECYYTHIKIKTGIELTLEYAADLNFLIPPFGRTYSMQ